MNTIQRIAKNTTSLFVAQFIVSILSLLLSVFIARYLGDVNFGKYTFALAYVAIFSLFSDLGYNTLMIREVAGNKLQASKYLNNVLSIRVLLSFIIFTVIVISINLMDYPPHTKNIVYILGLSTLITMVSDVFRVIFQAFEKIEYVAMTRTLFTLVRVLLCLFVLFLGYGLIEIVLVFLITSIFDFIVSFFICKRKFVKPNIEFDINFLKDTIKFAIPLGTLSFIGIINTRFDTLMLSVMIGDAAVGWYNAAYNLILGLNPIPRLFMTAILPLMYSLHVSSKESLKILSEKSLKYLFALGLPLAVGISMLADEIIILCYGDDFHFSIIVLQILAWDILLMFLINPLGGLLISMKKEKNVNIFFGLTALLNIILNLILIPSYSYIGAAVATVISETVLVTFYLLFISKYFHKFSLREIMTGPIVASSVMALFIHFSKSGNLFVLIFSAMIIYFILIYKTGYISKDELNLLKGLYKKTK